MIGKPLAAFALAGGLLAGGMTFASPAAAASSCSDAARAQFDVVFPDRRPQTAYYVQNCASTASGSIAGSSSMTWQIVDDAVVDNSTRFTSFKITTRVESRPTQDGADTVVTSKTCDWTTLVNSNYTYTTVGSANTCTAPQAIYDPNRWWSSDSTVVYDIAGDGQGAITKQLTGSPLIHG